MNNKLQRPRATIRRGGRMTKLRGAAVSIAPFVGAVVFSGLSAGQAQAQNECGSQANPGETISCGAAAYASGIAYTVSDPLNGLELVLDDPAIDVGTPGVSVTGSSSNTGNISILATRFGTINNTGGPGLSVNLNGEGSGTIIIGENAGDISTSGNNATGAIVAISSDDAGDALLRMNGGTITTDGLQANGLQIFQSPSASNSTGNLAIEMAGGTILAQGNSADGITLNSRGLGDTSVHMTGGSILVQNDLSGTNNFANGIASYVQNDGSSAESEILVTGAAINVESLGSFGVFHSVHGTGDSSVEITDGASVQVIGAGSSGIGVQRFSEVGGFNIRVMNGALVTGGHGSGAGISVVSASDGIISIGANAGLSAYSDLAIVTQLEPLPPGVTLGAVNVVNNGTIFGMVMFADQDDTFINASSNSWNIRNFADTDVDLVRDEEAVAVSDFGGGVDTFTNTGTVRLLTIEDMSGFTPGADDETAPLSWDTTTTAEYFPDANSASHTSAMLSITEAGIEQGHLVNLERFENAGLITMADIETGGTGPVAGDVFVITGGATAGTPAGGEFISNGGALHIDTVLNDGATDITDVLVVDRALLGTGATGISVTNAGGTGASTDLNGNGAFDADEGILVVQGLEAGSDAGAFALAGPVVTGAWQYILDQTDGNSWYLHSLMSSSATVYEATPYVILDGFTRMPTLEQRAGQRRGNSAAGTLEPTSGGWIRISGDGSDAELNTGTSYDADSWGLQAGYDLSVEAGESGQWVLGLTAQTGKASASIATMTGTGSVNAESFGFGVTATWYDYNGLYVDLQGQMNWASVDYASSLDGVLAEDELAQTAAASIEVGHRYSLDANRGLTPQAQLTWAHVDGGSFTDSAGNAVDMGTNERVTGRLGLAYDYQWRNADQGSIQNVYAIANILHDFSNGASVDVAGTSLASERDATWGEIGLGGSVTWNENNTLYAEASYRDSFGSGGGSGLSATVGLRVKW